MPERWEREVGKLATLEAPPSTSRRIVDGPHGDGMPPAPHRGQRAVAGAVALVVFGAAASLVVGAFRGSGDTAAPVSSDATKVVIQLTSSDQGPRADLVYGDKTAASQYSSYCWNGTTRCVDTSLVPFAASDFVTVPSGTPLVLDGDASLGEAFAWIALGNDPHMVNPANGGLVNPISDLDGNGRYVLSVFASWPLGSVTFYFPLEIVQPTEQTTPLQANEPKETSPSPQLSEVAVPDVDGMSAAEAQDALEAVGLAAVYRYWLNGAEDIGNVLSSEPGAGTRVSTGTSVDLWIAAPGEHAPNDPGWTWLRPFTRDHPGVLVGDGAYRGPDGYPVIVFSAGQDPASWRAELEGRIGSDHFSTSVCALTDEALERVSDDILQLSNDGALRSDGHGFLVDPATCSVRIEGEFPPGTIASLRSRFEDAVTIVDGLRMSRLVPSGSP